MSSSKKAFVLRIDERVFQALEKWAADEFRSVNGQIEFILDSALKSKGRLKKKPDSSSENAKEEGPEKAP
jgi:hypothetical protein